MTELRRLTGKQRYWQAVRKARIEAARQLRQLMAGKIGWTTFATMDREREHIIAEFDRLQRALDEARRAP